MLSRRVLAHHRADDSLSRVHRADLLPARPAWRSASLPSSAHALGNLAARKAVRSAFVSQLPLVAAVRARSPGHMNAPLLEELPEHRADLALAARLRPRDARG